MPSRELTLILTAFKARGNDRAGQSVEEARRELESLVRLCPVAPDVEVTPVEAGGVAAEWLVVPESRPERVLLFFHGGAYALGSLVSHRDLASRLARAAGARALAVDYRLAPEHPFPAAWEDACAVYGWLARQGVGTEQLTLAGDSAGGGLALACLASLPPGRQGACGVALFSPWVDLAGTGASIDQRSALDPVIQRAYLEHSARLYLAGADPLDPRASPLFGRLAGLPPLLVQVGTHETMYDDAARLVTKAKEEGVEAELEPWAEMFHGWQLYARLLPEGREAIERAGRFLAGCYERLGKQ
ncbi:MAG TPA: alpha/beta hydrolase [Thermoanaerobaculia bacterium]|nr:alpha/beta hydrolase [Thermoanaerobaculia bacterium]